MRHVLTALLLTLASLPIAAQGTPDVLYYTFDEFNGDLVNRAVPGRGTLNPGLSRVQMRTVRGQFNWGAQAQPTQSQGASIETLWNTDLGGGSWTIQFWLDMSAPPAKGAFGHIFGDPGAGNLRAFVNGDPLLGLGGIDTLMLRGVFFDVLVPGGSSQWFPVHVTLVRDVSTSEIRAYVDGTLVTTVAQLPFVLPTGTGFFVGGNGTLQSLPTEAVLDEFRVWSRALSDGEIASSFDVSLATQFPGNPSWQGDGARISFNVAGGSVSTLVPFRSSFTAGGAGTISLLSANLGQPWDLFVTAQPMLARERGALETSDGQVLNLDPIANDLTAAFGLFQSPGFADFTTGFSAPTVTGLSVQAAIFDPTAASGLVLSKGIRVDLP